MKKILFILMCAYGLMASAQNSVATAMPATSATYANTGADTATIKAVSAYANVAIQVVVTKNSGTVAGTVLPYGSLDGSNFVQIGTDTMKLTNQTTNTKIWNFQPSQYLYYRVRAVGSGTMNAGLKSWFLGK